MGGFKKVKTLPDKEVMNEDDGIDVDDEELESKSDSEPEVLRLKEPLKNAVYNEDGLVEKLEDIAWPEDVDWKHKLTVDHEQAPDIDVEDDLAREMAFYTQALDGTRKAFAILQSAGLPFLRPPDYYAEMVKSDSHMLKVKGKLLVEKKKIEEAEERKKARESKKIAKEVQAQKNKERTKRKKEDIESVKKWRKQRQQSGFAKGKDEDMGFNFDGNSFEKSKKKRPGVAPGDRSGGLRKQGWKSKSGMENKKRERRESKFGHGGRKGVKKQNTAETTNDLRDFNKGDVKKQRRKIEDKKRYLQ